MKCSDDFPENHPVKRLFRTLTERGLDQAKLHDHDLLLYLSNLLVDFIFINNLYKRDQEGRRLEYVVDLLAEALNAEKPSGKLYYKHIGDYSLFVLGMFPESLSRPGRAVSPDYYAEAGRLGYQTAGQLELSWVKTALFRKLAGEFDRCVVSLNWVKEYTSDPFYQYMFREFEIT